MKSEFFDKIIEMAIPTSKLSTVNQKSLQLAGKRLKIRGYDVIIFGDIADSIVPDVHGLPRGFIAYGRGGFDKRTGRLWMEGGPQGSSSGHPNSIEDGFYWGAKDLNEQGTILIRGRAGVSERTLVSAGSDIIEWISTKVPKY